MTASGWRIFAVLGLVLGLIFGGPVAAYDYAQYTRCQAGNARPANPARVGGASEMK